MLFEIIERRCVILYRRSFSTVNVRDSCTFSASNLIVFALFAPVESFAKILKTSLTTHSR